MKRKIFGILVLIFLAVIIYAAETSTVHENVRDMYKNVKIQPVFVATNQVGWKILDSTTSFGKEPNDLEIGGRTYASILADTNEGALEVSIVHIPPTWTNVRFRCIGVSEDSNVIYQVYAGTLAEGSDCELAKVGQLTFVIGTQQSTITGYKMADTVTATTTEDDWVKSWATSSPANNHVAEATVDLMGEDILVLVPTTADCDCKLLGKGF